MIINKVMSKYNHFNCLEYCLVFWTEDEQFSVVPKKKVKDGVPVGGTCSIKIGKQLHQAKILAVGKYTYNQNINKYIFYYWVGKII